jgi:hypothetical protein
MPDPTSAKQLFVNILCKKFRIPLTVYQNCEEEKLYTCLLGVLSNTADFN